MKKILILILTLTLLFGFSCNKAEETPVLLANDPQLLSTVSVSGKGHMSVEPDMATLELVIEKKDKLAGKALEMTAEAMDSVLKKLTEYGIAEEDIKTSGISVYESWEYDENGDRKGKVNYASHQLSVKIYEIEKTGEILDACINAGATYSYGINFGLKDKTSFEKELLKLAVENAAERADAIAEASGKTLGEIVSATDGTVTIPDITYHPTNDMVFEEAAESAAPAENAAPTYSSQMYAGTLELYATVEMQFEIK